MVLIKLLQSLVKVLNFTRFSYCVVRHTMHSTQSNE